jgi:hypothetical protein
VRWRNVTLALTALLREQPSGYGQADHTRLIPRPAPLCRRLSATGPVFMFTFPARRPSHHRGTARDGDPHAALGRRRPHHGRQPVGPDVGARRRGFPDPGDCDPRDLFIADEHRARLHRGDSPLDDDRHLAPARAAPAATAADRPRPASVPFGATRQQRRPGAACRYGAREQRLRFRSRSIIRRFPLAGEHIKNNK